MIVGYARVSTDGQSLDAQHVALAAAGAERVYAEKISGAVTDRKALAKATASPRSKTNRRWSLLIVPSRCSCATARFRRP
ncbi:MAG: recombinase family protein [Xanthobacteraceae bacterium]